MLLVIALLCFLLDAQINEYFVYNRMLVEELQLWRLFTGHAFHTNYAHFILNTLAIILLWALHGQFYSTKQYLLLCLFSGLIVSLAIYYFSPEMHQYVGLSGILHAIFVWGALKDIQNKEKTGYILMAGVIIKVAQEQFFGASEEVANLIDATVAIEAHLWGVIAGVIFYFSALIHNK